MLSRGGEDRRGAALALFPKSLATASLLAHIVTAKFVDALPLYRQETQFARLGVTLGRATMAGWMIRLGTMHVVPLINLLNEEMLSHPVIQCDESRLQVLNSDKAPTADHWMWVRASGAPGRRVVLFDYDPSRGGAVPKRLLEGYQGVLLTDGYEAYDSVAEALKLTPAGCLVHCPESPFIWSGRAGTAQILLSSLWIAPDNNSGRFRWMRGKRGGQASATRDARERARARMSARSAPMRRASSAGSLRRTGSWSRCWHVRGNHE